MTLAYTLTFVLGASLSAIVGIAFLIYVLERQGKFITLLKKEFERVLLVEIKKAHVLGSVNYRFNIIQDITKKQLDLLGHADQPSKGALHSKNRKNIAAELKALEDHKREIFQSFLNDNVDPVITVVDESGVKKEMRVSEFMNSVNTPPPPPPLRTVPPSAEPSTHRKTVLKLVKGEDDGKNSGDNPQGPALH